jgi:hypothetical protein
MSNYHISAIPYHPPHNKYDIVSGSFNRSYTYTTDTGDINYSDSYTRYFYSKTDNNTGSLAGNSDWDSPVNSGCWSSTEKFEWIPQYDTELTMENSPTIIQYGDGYKQIIKKGINSLSASINLKFENIPIEKAKAILHFIEYNIENDDDGNYQNIFEYQSQNPFDKGNYVKLYRSKSPSFKWKKYKLGDVMVTFEEVNAPSTLIIG